MSDIIGSGLAFPLDIDQRGGVKLLHGEDDVAKAIAIILATAPGERPMRPEFGCRIHDFVFAELDATTIGNMDRAIREALARWEPRIDVIDVAFELGRTGLGRVMIDIAYRLRATNSLRNLVYPFYLIPDEGAGDEPA